MSMKIFVPLTKVDIEKRLVYGTLAAEEPDRSGEVLDYASSKPHFQAWSSDISKATDGKSMGNLRAMHGKVAAGKFTDLQFDDSGKRIEACAKVVDNAEWDKVLEGVYTGFSIGGKYGKTWDDNGLRRYEAIPAEGSLVDYPCIPSATFKVMKADGTEELRKFTAATDASEAVDKLATLLNDGKLDPRELLKIAIADLQKRDFNQKERGEAADNSHVQKAEGGDGKSDDDADDKSGNGDDDADDKGGAKNGTDDKGDDKGDDKSGDDDAAKAAAASAAADALAKAGRRNSAGDQGYLQTAHDALVKAGAMCGGDDADQIDQDFAMAAGVDELCKAADMEPIKGKTALEKAANLVIALSKANARIKALEDEPAPTKGALRTISKAADMTVNQGTQDAAIEAELESAAKAQVEGDPVPMVKFIHKYGARPVRPNGPQPSK